MSEFPPVAMVENEDASYFSISRKDASIRVETEGGYVFTRPRSTRAPRRSFTTGFTDIGNADKATLEAFYGAKRGGSDSFTWTDPTTNVEHAVRFVGDLQFKYRGVGGTHLWSVEIKLEEV